MLYYAMRVNLFYPTIDCMITEMKERFSPQSQNVMLGIDACNPSSDTFLDISDLRKLATHYNMELFEPEVAVAKNYLQALQCNQKRNSTWRKPTVSWMKIPSQHSSKHFS